MTKLPRQIALVLSAFPASEWAPQLVNAVNQFALEVVQAFLFASPKYKTLDFTVGLNQEDSFPIDFPVDATPNEVRVASPGDDGLSAVTVKWVPITITASQLGVRINYITGLSSNTTYSIRLAYQ